jgi:hypothetical protein
LPLVAIGEAIVVAHHHVGASNPDDITSLGDPIHVTHRSDPINSGIPVGSVSTISAYDSTRKPVATSTIAGRCDGLTAGPTHHRTQVTANEDISSSPWVIQPGTTQPAHDTDSPDPAQTGSDRRNRGTDASGSSRWHDLRR